MELGFKPNKRRPRTDLEERLNLFLCDKEDELFPGEIGNWKMIYTERGVVYGCYQGITEKGFAVLLPHVVTESDPHVEKGTDIFRVETRHPKYVSAGIIRGLDVLSLEYLNTLTKQAYPSFPCAD